MPNVSKPALILLCILVSLTALPAQIAPTICKQARTLVDVMARDHVQPLEWNDVVSVQVFEGTLAELDAAGLYFTQQDLDRLGKHREALDEEVAGARCLFIRDLAKVYRKAIARADSIVHAQLAVPMTFASAGHYTVPEKGDFAESTAELGIRWTQALKAAMLRRMFTPLTDADEPLDLAAKELMEREAMAREKVLRRIERNLKRRREPANGFQREVGNKFLNVIAAQYDPHSAFFTLSAKEAFEFANAPESASFGFSLNQTIEGDIRIARLAPGSAAWKSNELHKGDVLIRCEFKDGRILDLTEIELDEFNEAVTGVEKVKITVRKADGRIRTVSLTRSPVRQEQNTVQGLMLAGQDGKPRVGYVSLPGFYSDWENDQVHGCANDVAKKIVKLKRENMEGLILDLRNNGGGSVKEAMELAGIFIDRGPLMIVRGNEGKPLSIKDPNLGFAWGGPLIVLVNGLSASASEFVAAALQDHRRAVIVGSTTYGKSTGQNILPLTGGFGSMGFVKVTTGRFNRITGDSHQRRGVRPDVALPDIYERLDFREEKLPNAFMPDHVDKKMYYTPGPEFPLDMLRSRSLDRVDNDDRFVGINALSKTVQEFQQRWGKRVPLQLEAYRKMERAKRAALEALTATGDRPATDFKVQDIAADKEILEMDEYGRASAQYFREKIAGDIYIEEAFRIIEDMR